jgi:ribosomal protein L12E/L44/L45/RPP1/RPP2
VDRTGENEIDIDEFISAIQREAKIQVGKPDLEGAFCILKPSTKVATASNTNTTAILETFPIRKLGFVIELANSDELTQPPVAAQEKKKGRPPKKNEKGKEKEKGKESEKESEEENDDEDLGVEKEKRKKRNTNLVVCRLASKLQLSVLGNCLSVARARVTNGNLSIPNQVGV